MAVPLRRMVGETLHAEAAEEFTQTRWKLVVAETVGRRTAIHLDANGDHGRLHLGDDIGKADRRPQLLRLLAQILGVGSGVALREVEAGAEHEGGGA